MMEASILSRHMHTIFTLPLSLQVLETCVKNCGHRFHVQVANRDFMDGVLVKIITPKNNPPTIVQDKVLSLIQVLQKPSSVLMNMVVNLISCVRLYVCCWTGLGRRLQKQS